MRVILFGNKLSTDINKLIEVILEESELYIQ